MITSEIEMKLAEIDAASEMFEDALVKVLENIEDPNTGDQARRITLDFAIIPDPATGLNTIKVACKTKLAAVKEWEGRFVAGREKGKMVARMFERQRQPELPLNVTQIRKEAE